VEDEQKIVEGGVSAGRAILGGSFFGNTGAGIGGLSKIKKADKEFCTSMQIIYSVKNNKQATRTIPFIFAKSDKSKVVYSQAKMNAKSTLEGFNYIISCNESTTQTDSALENFEDLKKLKELLDLGILTEEEFESKKAELLK
ncbi:MAG: SHOCT domain-containing protein, partial [Enterococcus hulanensis]